MKERLERHQVWFYLAAIGVGLGLGGARPDLASHGELLIWPLLAGLLYTTFTQVPLRRLPLAFKDWRFMSALLVGNFVVMPLCVGGLLQLLPDDPAIQLGVLLVLLVPCTDWFISFTHLGKGDAGRAVAATPILLLGQFIALPFYLWWFIGDVMVDAAIGEHLLYAFFGLIGLPLLLAGLTQRWAASHWRGDAVLDSLGWLPVPLLALVVGLVAATQVAMMNGILTMLGPVLLVFVLYLLLAVGVGKLLARCWRLPLGRARTLVFSLSTRNSFVVLPLALMLPTAWEATAVIIVLQSLVELFAMALLIHWLPHYWLPAAIRQ
ncbi:arsenic resistance protein [Halomonas sp. Bachu 37]|uniref:arsenic resistance protein n=1 Tax=Halomonas kashgarensis TaxID=3084920 RepID=UPI0032162794